MDVCTFLEIPLSCGFLLCVILSIFFFSVGLNFNERLEPDAGRGEMKGRVSLKPRYRAAYEIHRRFERTTKCNLGNINHHHSGAGHQYL